MRGTTLRDRLPLLTRMLNFRRLDEMLVNLNKVCSTSAYMYLYRQRLLQGLEDGIGAGGGKKFRNI